MIVEVEIYNTTYKNVMISTPIDLFGSCKHVLKPNPAIERLALFFFTIGLANWKIVLKEMITHAFIRT